MVKKLPGMLEDQVQSLGGKIPWRTEWQHSVVFLPGGILGQRCLVDDIHGVAKSQTRLNH